MLVFYVFILFAVLSLAFFIWRIVNRFIPDLKRRNLILSITASLLFMPGMIAGEGGAALVPASLAIVYSILFLPVSIDILLIEVGISSLAAVGFYFLLSRGWRWRTICAIPPAIIGVVIIAYGFWYYLSKEILPTAKGYAEIGEFCHIRDGKCFGQVAAKRNDKSICNIYVDSWNKQFSPIPDPNNNLCLQTYAEMIGDNAYYCSTLPRSLAKNGIQEFYTSSKRDECFMNYAIKANDMNMCRNIDVVLTRRYCCLHVLKNNGLQIREWVPENYNFTPEQTAACGIDLPGITQKY